jgi:hypothetical protein
MKMILTAILFAALAFGQAGRNRDLGSSNVRRGGTLPSTCQASPNADVFYKSGAALGLYVCTSGNVWVLSVPGATLDAPSGASTLTEVNALPQITAAGVLGVSRIKCVLGICTVEAAAANPTTLIVQASAGQGTTDLFQVKNSAGGLLAYGDYLGRLKGVEIIWGAGTEATCDASNRGRVVMAQGASGASDTLRICMKNSADVYAFKELIN